MSFWLIVLAADAALSGYVASLWAHGHQAILHGPPHGLHGHGFLAYLAIVVALAAMTPWVLLEGRRLTGKVWLVLLDLAALYIDRRVLSDPQQQFAEWAGLVALYNSAFLYPVLAFHVLGPLTERLSGASSPEVQR